MFLAIILKENENHSSYNKPPPLAKAVHKLQTDFLSHSALEKHYVCYIALPFITTILSKTSNDIVNRNER